MFVYDLIVHDLNSRVYPQMTFRHYAFLSSLARSKNK
jgi:hypothetical protein